MASVNISIPKGFPFTVVLEAIGKFNRLAVVLNETDDVILPTLILEDKTEVCGVVPIAYALARTSKAAPKGWAKNVLGDGVASKGALIQQFASIAENIFLSKAISDIKVTIGQIHTYLKTRTFLVSDEVFQPSMADVVLALALYPFAHVLSDNEREKQFTDFTRWIIHVNNLLGCPYPELPIPKNVYHPQGNKGGQQQHQQQQKGQKGGQQQQQQGGQQQQKGQKQPKQPKQPKAAPKQEEDTRDPFSWIDVRVGKIVKVGPHPNADTLYCEDIDIGNGVIRKVVTGVRNYVPIEQMQDRHVIVFTNIKPSKIRSMPSESMVFAGSNADHTVVELLDPPADAPIGTRIVCGDFVQGEVPGVDKKGKYWEAVIANKALTINENHEACYKGVPLSCEYGKITVKSLANCEFH